VYSDDAEKAMRLEVFKTNVAFIESVNSGTDKFWLEANQFADITEDEFKATYTRGISHLWVVTRGRRRGSSMPMSASTLSRRPWTGGRKVQSLLSKTKANVVSSYSNNYVVNLILEIVWAPQMKFLKFHLFFG
jgi:hypothetical protein